MDHCQDFLVKDNNLQLLKSILLTSTKLDHS